MTMNTDTNTTTTTAAAPKQREYQNLKSFKVETPAGPVLITPTSASSVYVHNDRECGGEGFTVNRVSYRVAAHFSRYPEGWALHLYEDDGVRSCVSMHRTDRAYNKQISDAARKKAASLLLQVVEKWAEENPKELLLGGLGEQNNNIQRVESGIRELREKLKEQEELLRSHEAAELALLDKLHNL